jgi:transposase
VHRYNEGGVAVARVHEVVRRVVRDLPILDAVTWLSVPRRRLACPRCGPKLERLSWLDRHARVTRRLAASVVQLCAVLPVKQVAAFFELHWETVKTLDKAALSQRLDPVELTGVELLAMDEFALQRGHRYATVVIEPRTGRVRGDGDPPRQEVTLFPLDPVRCLIFRTGSDPVAPGRRM